MHVSPPITILAIVAVMVAVTAWLAPPPGDVAQVSVVLSAATHQKLAILGKQNAAVDGRTRTVTQVIQELANTPEKDCAISVEKEGARGRLSSNE